MIYGILAPDAGEMFWDGEPVEVANPRAARKLGIGMVFQHFSLFEALTVLETSRSGRRQDFAARPRGGNPPAFLDLYGLKARSPPHRHDAQRRRAPAHRDRPRAAPDIAAVDHGRADLVLTPQEVRALYSKRLRKLAASGCSILYISHKLHEIIALCDTATILRAGRVVAECDPQQETSRAWPS